MNKEIMTRLDQFRALLSKHGVQAAIVPQADPHQGEYLAPHWQVRRWLSGFTGSAGDLVVTAGGAALWTDSRYFLQAAQQLEGTGIELMKSGLCGTPTMAEYLCRELKSGDIVGLDGILFTKAAVDSLKDSLGHCGIKLVANLDVIDEIWHNRPALPDGKIYVHELCYSGRKSSDKIEAILHDAREKGCEAVFECMLDSIAWTLNIRCNDVKHTPVATSFLYLAPGASKLFIDGAKLTAQTRAYLAGEGVEVLPYNEVKNFLESLQAEDKVLVDSSHTAYELLNILGDRAVDGGISAANRFKSVKNDVELQGIRRAMLRDGVAMVRSLMEIKRRVNAGEATDELAVAEILRHYRSIGENYSDESFGTIAGYGPHGAIVHYEASAESSATLRPEGLLLIDSGAQYIDGTTDITRTIVLGTPTAAEKRDFTLVMKGHIALAQAVFPIGTCGTQLDVLAHQYLWQHGLNYLHGTGHGVGHFLSVHEGPHSIRMNYVGHPVLPGTVTSNEPGLYVEGVHGIRCENLVECVHAMTTGYGDFLRFETLTLCPFERSLFDTSLMTENEIKWVNDYHATVAARLMPLLASDDERRWLADATQALEK